MARKKQFVTDQMWERIKPHLPALPKNPKGGRPWRSDRECLEGILWVLKSGAQWELIPEHCPSPSTCWRRLKRWEEEDIWLDIWRAFLGELDEKGTLIWEETFGDGTFIPAKKGASASARPNAERVRSLWWWQTARVFLWEFTLPLLRKRKSI